MASKRQRLSISRREANDRATDQTGLIDGFTAREQQIYEDYEWCLHDPEIQRTYGGKVVAVHNRRVWGAGKTYQAAAQAAQRCPGCPPPANLARVYIEGVPLGPGYC
jgi:hypothetical protein